MASLSHPKSSVDLLISILFIGLCIAAHNEVTLTFPFVPIVFNQCISVESNVTKDRMLESNLYNTVTPYVSFLLTIAFELLTEF